MCSRIDNSYNFLNIINLQNLKHLIELNVKANLIPTLHRKSGLMVSMQQLILLLAGIGTIMFFRLHHG
jgi:hypothetical protein